MISKSTAWAGLAAAGLTLAAAACGGGSPSVAPASSAPASTTVPAASATSAAAAATTAPAAVTTPAAASGGPAGTWTVAYAAAPTTALGQYTIAEASGVFTITTATALRIPDAGCSLPAGVEVGTFTTEGAGSGTYSGTEQLYDQGSCTPAGSSALLTVTAYGSNTLLFLVPGQQTVQLTRVGSAVAAAGAATAPATAAAPCTMPDEIGAGEDGHVPAAAAEQDVAATCSPVGLHVITVLTVSGPAGTPQGSLWKEIPAPGASVSPGESVHLYFQP